jgi:PAS domain S-box-containing protein
MLEVGREDGSASPSGGKHPVRMMTSPVSAIAGEIGTRFDAGQLANLVALGPTWVWETDALHRYSYISPAMEAATGVLVADLIGKTRAECFFDRAAMSDQMATHVDDLENRRPFTDFVFHAWTREGSRIWVSVSGTPQFNAKGAFTGYLGVSRALSERSLVKSGLISAAQQLEKLEALMAQVFDSVPVGIALFDKDNRYIASNALYRTMFAGIDDLLVAGTPIDVLLDAAFERDVVTVEPFSEGETRTETHAKWRARRLEQIATGQYADLSHLSDGRSLKQLSRRLDDGTFISVRVDVTDKLQQERREAAARGLAEKMQNRLSDAIEGLSTGFALWDKDNQLVTCNERFRSLISSGTQFSEGERYEAIMRRVADQGEVTSFNGLSKEDWLDSDRRQMEEEPEIQVQYRLTDGRWVMRRVTASPNGEKIDIRTDITELKAKEAAIAAAQGAAENAQARLRDAIASLSTGFALWDAEDRLIVFNDQLKDMASPHQSIAEGETYEAIMRRLVRDGKVHAALESGDPERWLEELLARRARKADVESLYLSQAGRWILQRETMTPSGERVDVRTDVTDFKAKEDALSKALEDASLAQEVIHHMDEPVFVKDENMRFVFCNAAFARLFGFSPADFIGKCASDFVTAREAKEFEASERQVLANGEAFEIQEDHFQDGRQMTRLVRKALIVSADGARHVACYMFDITGIGERERALAEAGRRVEAADRAKSEFLAQMGHEFRTPMNGVLGMVEMLQDSGLDQRQSMFVEIIRRSGQSLLSALNTIIDFTKLDGGTMEVNESSFPLRTAIEDEIEGMVADAEAKGVDFVLDIHPALPSTVASDEALIRTMLHNLVCNAVKFTDEGQIIVRVTGRDEGEGRLTLLIAVSDTGSGIPPEQIATVFDRFSGIQAGPHGHASGIGLGLSIVARIAARLGGQCSVKSTPGSGSLFEVAIPVACHDARAPVTPVGTGLRDKRLLVIEPDPAWREALVVPLKHWGFDAAAVADLPTAVELAKHLMERGKAMDLVFIGSEGRHRSCVQIARELDDALPFAPIAKVLVAPPSAVSARDRQMLRVQGVLPALLRQASLFHTTIGALSARASATPDAAAEAAPPPPVIEALPASLTAPSASASASIIAVEDNPLNQIVLLNMLGEAAIDHEILSDAAGLADRIAAGMPELVLLDLTLPGTAPETVLAGIRNVAPDLPVIAMTSPAAAMDAKGCLAAGFNDVIAKPLTPDLVLAAIGRWTSAGQRKSA